MRQLIFLALIVPNLIFGQDSLEIEKRLEQYKTELIEKIDNNSKMTQVLVDKVFSFSELGFQEIETSKYLTAILEENGFSIEHGISGIPTAWWAKWGSGKPIVAIGSDLDCIPKASQKPGIAYHDPIIEGAPGHGEGHNSGSPLNILAVLAVKEIMQRDGLQGTLIVWPGVAEELVGTKAFYTRDGYFDDVDLAIFTHVSRNLTVSYGQARGTGLISVEYEFEGEAAHAAGAPWRGRSAADAVELMNIGWQYQREHLDPLYRSHSVINNGGDQPNVAPPKASIWDYLRHVTYPKIMEPQIVEAAWDYFKNEQGMEMEYVPMITEEDSPAIYLNEDIQGEFRPLLEKFYYDESKYETYLEQLGIEYPTLRIEKNY